LLNCVILEGIFFTTYLWDISLDGRETAFVLSLLTGNIPSFQFIVYPTRNYRIFCNVCFSVLWRDHLQKSFSMVKFVSLKCLIPTNFKWISMEWPICERQLSPIQGFLSLIMSWDYLFFLFLSDKMTYSAFVIISCMSDILIMGCETKFYQLV
jgi:hypothetical protein